ncbi:MAG: DUF1573 domain-containing protein [Bacteroidota bacterium]
MKRFFALFTVLTFAIGVSFAQEKHDHNHEHKGHNHDHAVSDGASDNNSLDGPKMTFEFKEYDYGKIAQNSDGVREFPFENNGTEPLIIKHAKGSCGCTVPSYPKAPIMPGEKAVIGVKYDTKRVGPFSKSVRIITNASQDPIVLTIKGNVQKEPEGLPEKQGNGLGGF